MSGEGSLAVTVERDVFILAVGAQGPQGPPEDTSGFGTMAVQDADAVAITGGSISVPIVTATTEFRGTVLTSNAASDVALKTSGGTQLNVLHLANAVNYCQARGGAASGRVRFGAAGNDSNIGLNLGSKGTGDVIITTDAFGYQQFVFSHTANAVNYGVTTGAPVGNAIWFAAAGDDSAVQIGFASKSTSPIIFRTGGIDGTTQFAVSHAAGAVNFMNSTGAAAGSSPGDYSTGADSNIGILRSTRGSGVHVFYTDSFVAPQFRIGRSANAVNFCEVLGGSAGNSAAIKASGDSTDIEFAASAKGAGNLNLYTNNFTQKQLSVIHVASAVNYGAFGGATTGSSPYFLGVGGDTNVGITFATKGAGGFGVYSQGGSALQAFFSNTTSAVNYLVLTGAVTGAGPEARASGSDTDVDLRLSPRGAGVLRFGTHSALGAEVLSGFITIKDSGGTTRKLAVIS